MTYDPIDSDADGVVDANIDNESVNTEHVQFDYSSDYPASPRQPDGYGWPAFGSHPKVDNPVFTAGDFDLSTGEAVETVADPFIVRDGGTFYMFFEAKETVTPAQTIHYATSGDGLTWSHQGEMFSSENNDSFPHVFKENGTWYMVPMDAGRSTIPIYEGNPFPTSWSLVSELTIPSSKASDYTVWQYGGLWWAAWEDTNSDGNDVVRLAFNDSLTDDSYTEHPSSPIRSGSSSPNERPGGRPIVHDDYVDIPMQQNSSGGTYGYHLNMYRITELTTDTYTEHEIAGNPLLQGNQSFQGGADTWNSVRMHHIDTILNSYGDVSFAVVDGATGAGPWSVGIVAPTSRSPVSVQLGTSSGQTFSDGSTTVLQLDQSFIDTHNQHDESNYTWTAPRSGYYNLSLQIGTQDASSTGRVTVDVENLTTGSLPIRTNTTLNSTPTYSSLFIPRRQLYLSSGDEIQVSILNESGGSFEISSGNDQTELILNYVNTLV